MHILNFSLEWENSGMFKISNVLEQSLESNANKPRSPGYQGLPTADQEKIHLLSDLLPYDPCDRSKERLEKSLNEYRFLLTALDRAMGALEREEFSLFDPLVGENACQIRALKNALVFNTSPIDKSLLPRIREIKNKLDLISYNVQDLVDEGISLKGLLESEDANISLNYNELYLATSYFLTIVKVDRPSKSDLPYIKNEYTDPKKLKELGNIGTMFAESLIKNLRITLSQMSCQFVQTLADILPLPQQIQDAVSDKYMIIHRRLQCLPCYWTTLLLMLEALKSEIPIVVIGHQMAEEKDAKIQDETTIFFEATAQGYIETSKDSFDPNQPALILLGSSYGKSQDMPKIETWRKELVKHGPMDLVLAYAAIHRQYPDESKDPLVEQIDDKRFDHCKKQAEEWGCSVENPSLFFLSHAFCDKIGNLSKHTLHDQLESIIRSKRQSCAKSV